MMVETMDGNNMDSIKYFNSVLLKMKLTDISRMLILWKEQMQLIKSLSSFPLIFALSNSKL